MKVKYIIGFVIVIIAGLVVWGIQNMTGQKGAVTPTFLFAITGSKQNTLKEPTFAVSDQRGNIFVSDSRNGRIAVFDKKGKFLRNIGEKGAAKPLSYPMGIGVLKDSIVVADAGARMINQYSVKGEFLKTWKMNEPIEPVGVYVDSDSQVYITDLVKGRILIFSADGQLIKELIADDFSLGTPMGISLDSKGDIWLADSGNYNIKVISQKGQLIDVFDGGPQQPLSMAKGLAIDEKNRIYVTDTLAGVVRVFDQNGNDIVRFGRNDEEQTIQFPLGIYADNDRIYIVDQGSNQIQVWAWK